MEIKYPIAETFTSIHGEGAYVGTPMTFLRFAGCTVGRPAITKARIAGVVDSLAILPSGRNADICTTFDGRHFPCDTDFKCRQYWTKEELIKFVPSHIKHVCITGGEPLMHHEILRDLVYDLLHRDIMVHIETSGTIIPPESIWQYDSVYIACSPKWDYKLEFIWNFADEIRLMVDRDFSNIEAQKIVQEMNHKQQLFLCPLSEPYDVMKISKDAMEKCLELIEIFPSARISIQQHKILDVR